MTITMKMIYNSLTLKSYYKPFSYDLKPWESVVSKDIEIIVKGYKTTTETYSEQFPNFNQKYFEFSAKRIEVNLSKQNVNSTFVDNNSLYATMDNNINTAVAPKSLLQKLVEMYEYCYSILLEWYDKFNEFCLPVIQEWYDKFNEFCLPGIQEWFYGFYDPDVWLYMWIIHCVYGYYYRHMSKL